jgi:serine/threonine protein kinase
LSSEQIRLCPTCGQESPPEVLRCGCGALLVGIDLTAPGKPQEEAAPATPTADENASAAPLCPHADCGQPNPAGSTRCLYCDRPLDSSDDGLSGTTPGTPTLISLPAALRERYRIERPLPATGAEAELLIVRASNGEGPELVAKIYRHGIHPNREVQERIATIDPAHRVEVLDKGVSDGFAYELMEYCRAGSLRDLLRSDAPLPPDRLREVIAELAAAVDSVHQAGLIHRDLKPENMLVRSLAPLDLVLTDFGIASLQNATLRFTSTARTLAYGAPETMSGVIDGKADWWSLGMTVLEAALGSHPFAGLSEAVILHRLLTRSIDLSGINEPTLKILLRGLLQRDPKTRWGNGEIQRWLAGDQTLPVPVEERQAAPSGRAYQIGDDFCQTPEELGIALARHWQKALSDLNNGLLMNWFRKESKDQNRERLLIELNFESQLAPDLRLLRLIIDLAPGLPPVWRGQRIGLRDILLAADRALKNDAEAISLLDQLYDQRVLEAYATVGNSEAADIVRRWHGAVDSFDAAWRATIERLKANRLPGDTVPFEELMFGQGGPTRPSPRQLHARLLALAYDEGWSQRLREILVREVPRLAIHCRWLPTPAELAQLDAPNLLALECLLPEARKQAKRASDRELQAQEEMLETGRRLRSETSLALNALIQAGSHSFFSDDELAELRRALENFNALSVQVRALGGGDASQQTLRNQIVRQEPVVSRICRLLEAISERKAINRGWINGQTLGFYAMALFMAPIFFSGRLTYPMLLGGLVFLLWRLLPNYFAARQLRDWVEKLDAA